MPGLVVLLILGLKVTLRCYRPTWWGTVNPADPIKTLGGTVHLCPLPRTVHPQLSTTIKLLIVIFGSKNSGGTSGQARIFQPPVHIDNSNPESLHLGLLEPLIPINTFHRTVVACW